MFPLMSQEGLLYFFFGWFLVGNGGTYILPDKGIYRALVPSFPRKNQDFSVHLMDKDLFSLTCYTLILPTD